MSLIARNRFAFALSVFLILNGCAAPRLLVPQAAFAESVENSGVQPDSATEAGDTTITDREKSVVEVLKMPERTVVSSNLSNPSNRFSSTDKLTAAASDLPLRDFLAYVFGDLLKVPYIVADGSAGLDKPVTLNTPQAVSSSQLYRLTEQIINQNGLGLTERDGVYFIGPATGKSGDIFIGFGSKISDVPDSAGRILQVVPLRFGYNPSIERTIKQFVDVEFQEDPFQNAMFLTGYKPAILKALEIIRIFDQPSVRSSRVGIINLTYVSSKEFVDQVSSLLRNEGVNVGVERARDEVAIFVPLERLGAVAVFAVSDEVLDRVEFWAKQVDRPSQGPSLRYFVYQPQNARASDLAESLTPLIGIAVASVSGGNQARDTRSAVNSNAQSPAAVTADNAARRDRPSTQGEPPVSSVSGDGVVMTVDPRSNSIIFLTTGPRYEALLPLIKRLDIQPKQVLLEATIAEVSLSGEFANGVEFALTDGKLSGGTLGRLGLPSGGIALSYVENLTDQALLRLQASDSRVNVLSRPVLVVRDGIAASISVGNDVPTVGATASDPIESNRTVTTVLYRKTGINLTITPTVNAQGVVVMEIAQQISNTVPGSSGVSGAPIFFERSVSTEVVARSGQSVLLAGLISETGSQTSEGIPWLRKLPLVGAAFRSDGKKQEKTELILLLTPKVLEGPEDWDIVRSRMGSLLQQVELPSEYPAASAAGKTTRRPSSRDVNGQNTDEPK
jgi:general secretion pathway protein D